MLSFLPTVSKLCAKGTTPAVGTASYEGRNPKIPQYDAGTLTLPPVSVPVVQRTLSLYLRQTKIHQESFRLDNLPKEKSTIFAPTATADPLEDPPGTRSGAHGFIGVP